MGQTKVMVVDQGRRTALRLERQLRELGCSVAGPTTSIDQALIGVPRWQPDAIILDLRLARGVDGREAVRRLKEASNAALLFLASKKHNCELEPEMAALASGYLVVPAASLDVQATLGIALARRMRRSDATGVDPHLLRLLDSAPVLLAYLDASARYQFANRLHEKWFGIPVDKLPGRSMLEVLGPAWNRSLQGAFGEALEGDCVNIEHLAQDASDRHAQVSFVPDKGPNGVRGVYMAACNVSNRVELERVLRAERDDLRAVIDSLDESIIAFDAAGQVRALNRAAQELTGLSIDQARGRSAQDLLRFVDGASGRRVADPVGETLAYGRPTRLAPGTMLLSQDGVEHAVDDSCAPLCDANGTTVGAVMVLRKTDVPDVALAAAGHDRLTGLMNRAQFEAALDARIAKSARIDAPFALLHIDIDSLREINEAHGHHAGDAALLHVAEALGTKLRSADLVGRIGGDEFAVLAEDCPPHRVQQVAEAVLHALQEAGFSWHGHSVRCECSIGAATIGGLIAEGVSLLNAAELACALAKEEGGGRVAVYRSESERGEAAMSHAEGWAGRMEGALAHDRFRLYAQRVAAIDDPDGRRGNAFEVLVRLEGRGGVMLPPMAFMPADERSMLMARLDRWVIRSTLQALATRLPLPSSADAPLTRYAINLSAASLADEGIVDYIAAQLAEYAVPPQTLCFEVAESAALAALQRTEALAAGLKKLGCGFALDHFASGVSAREYLQHLPVSYIKIDGSFVKGMLYDELDHAVVEGISRIGHALGIQTVAGHAESDAIIKRLREIGVPHAQGYAIHRPEPLLRALEAHADLFAGEATPPEGPDGWSAEWQVQ